MNNKEFVLSSMRNVGKTQAQALQENSENMTSTELKASKSFIPRFQDAITVMNMLERPIGFTVKTKLGNVCKLLNSYDSSIYPGEPETLPAQWGFKHSTDPSEATEFIASSTSTYNIGECTIGSDGITYRSTIDHNNWDPVVNPQYWEVA